MSKNAAFFGLDDAPRHARPEQSTADFNRALLGDLKGVFRRAWSNHPRSQQRAIGPSEIGHPCPRRLASTLLELSRVNPEGDPLPAWLGTAGHAKFEDAVNLDNERLIAEWEADREQRCTLIGGVTNGEPIGRWFTERRVTVRDGLSGTCDLYDTWTDTVIDLKFPGKSRFDEYRKFGPIDKAPEYRVQAHAYGRGYVREGFPVKRVAIWFVPRGGTLAASFVWSEPYSDQIIDGALDKLDNINMAIEHMGLAENPERVKMLPRATDNCMYCPFFAPILTSTAVHACAGDAE